MENKKILRQGVEYAKTLPRVQRFLNKIVIHSSKTKFGESLELLRFQTLDIPKGMGLKNIGYHFIITNQYPFYYNLEAEKPNKDYDGAIHSVVTLEEPVSHCGENDKDSIAICMVGGDFKDFTPAQMDSIKSLVFALMFQYSIRLTHIFGHKFFNRETMCPNFSVKKRVIMELEEIIRSYKKEKGLLMDSIIDEVFRNKLKEEFNNANNS